MSQKSRETRVITFPLDEEMLAEQVATDLRLVAGPWRDGDRVKRRIARAARAIGLAYWRTHDFWYRKARRIDPAELAAIAAAVAHLPAADAAGAFPVTPESDVDRLRSLETEVAALRSLLVDAIQRMEGEAHA